MAKVSPSHLRGEYLRYVEEHEFLPDHVKGLAKDMVARHFSSLRQEIGALDLAVRRTVKLEG